MQAKVDQSGDAGVGIGGVFAKSNRMSVDKNLIQTNLHELLHTQLMGMICMKGMKKIHYTEPLQRWRLIICLVVDIN